MRRRLLPVTLSLLLATALQGQSPREHDRALALLDRGIQRMGGDSLLRSVTAVRLDVLTLWHRTAFGTLPFPDQPSYEHNVELRDYTTRAWRNTRGFLPEAPGRSIVDIVRDTVGARYGATAPNAPPAWVPLNLAYIDERRELFITAPERLLLLARADARAATLPDTTIDATAYHRVSATLDGWRSVILLRSTDGLPAMVRFSADETNDFGLAPWGIMEVEYWYSGWQKVPPGVLLPRQRDVRRVGRPYKRMTVLATTINPPVPADSFGFSDSIATAYLTTQRRPMWAVPLDSVAIQREHFAAFPPFVGLPGAVRVGGRWVLIETGQAAGSAERVAAWLRQATPETPIGAGIVTFPATGNGGVRWVVGQRLPLLVAPGAVPWVSRMLGGLRGTTVVPAPAWVRVGSDSLWLEPLPVPDYNGTLAIYSPTLRWLYLPMAGSPVVADLQADLIARLAARGLPVEWIGSARGGLATAVAPSKT